MTSIDAPQAQGDTTRAAISNHALSKVPHVTLGFWAIKVLATTLGETGGDALSMTLNLGYAVSTLIFLALFLFALTFQIRARGYHPACYWPVVVATTTVGTTASDYFDRTLSLGYVRSTILLSSIVALILLLWRLASGRISADPILSRKDEAFYWSTILASNTLGTALGDFVATTAGLGFERGALVFAGLIGVVAAIHVITHRAPALLFWAA